KGGDGLLASLDHDRTLRQQHVWNLEDDLWRRVVLARSTIGARQTIILSGGVLMRCKMIVVALLLWLAAAHGSTAAAAEARHFSFAYDQPHTTAYGIAADTFANKLAELSHGTMIIDQFPGAQLGQEPQVLQKLRTGDIDFAITSTANSATVQPEAGVFSIHFVFRSEDHLKKALADPEVLAAYREMMNSKVEGA